MSESVPWRRWRRWRRATLAAGLFVLLSSCAGPGQYLVPAPDDVLHSFGAAARDDFQEAITVLVWNLHKGQKDGWRADLSQLGERADLVLLQEAVLSEQMRATFASLGSLTWDYAASFEYPSRGYSTGVIVGSRVQPRAVGYLRSPGREPVIGTPKMAVLASYPLRTDADALLVVNVHGNLAVSAGAFTKQMQAIASAIERHPGPVIWGGDFNTWSGHRFDRVHRMAQELGLAPVRFDPDGRTKFLGNAIDHAFVRGLEVVSARAFAHVDSSDHVPFSFVVRAHGSGPERCEGKCTSGD